MLALLLVAGPTAFTGDDTWFVDPITVKIPHDRRQPFATSTKAIDLAGMKGECERAQVWGWDDGEDLTDVTMSFTPLTSGGWKTWPGLQWSYKQQGYVNTSTPTKYLCATDILAPPGTHSGTSASAGRKFTPNLPDAREIYGVEN
jgi:L-ascorbate metabolism protein UlaG (beta-lactamase superfamily)